MRIKKKILQAQTNDKFVDFAPPRTAKSEIPDWFKSIPSIVEGQMSIKRCVPILDAFTSGYMIVTNVDFMFDEHSGRFLENATYNQPISQHMDFQTEEMIIDKNLNPHPFKWINTGHLKAPKGYSLLITHPFNRTDLPFQSLTGIVDSDTHPVVINFPFFMKKGFSGLIPAGTPLVQIIPIKREPWKLKINDQESYFYKDFWRWNIQPEATYKRKFWHRKDYS
jgi:hypothetical protein